MHPIAFQIGSFSIHWYGILVGLGCLVGLWTASRRSLREGFPPEKVYDMGLWLMLGVIVGARAFFIVTHWESDFSGHSWFSWFNLRQGGLVFYGGFIGAVIATLLYCRIQRAPLWRLADVLAPSIALGSVLGRFGCLMTGCCYGSVCTLPWGIRFPYGHMTHGTTVHPTQVYDALLNLLVYGFLEWLFRRKKFDGQVFAAWLLVYPIARSIAEVFRGDYPALYLGNHLTPAHLVSMVIFTIGVVLYRLLPRRLGKPTPAG